MLPIMHDRLSSTTCTEHAQYLLMTLTCTIHVHAVKAMCTNVHAHAVKASAHVHAVKVIVTLPNSFG